MSNETPRTSIGERRMAIRVNAGMTQEELARAAAVSLGTVKRAEQSGMLQERLIRSIAEALGCTPAEYLG